MRYLSFLNGNIEAKGETFKKNKYYQRDELFGCIRRRNFIRHKNKLNG